MSDLLYFDDVGAHRHALLRDVGATNSSGPHGHVWLVESAIGLKNGKVIPDMTLLISLWDGAHSHPLDELATKAKTGVHRHAVSLPSRTRIGTAEDGDHVHVLLVNGTGVDGPHAHAVEIAGQKLQSLLPADFARLMEAENEGGPEPILREGTSVQIGDKIVCEHKTWDEAQLCLTKRSALRLTGLGDRYWCENLEEADWILDKTKDVEFNRQGKPLVGRLLKAMGKLTD